jgi:hypothetical protein
MLSAGGDGPGVAGDAGMRMTWMIASLSLVLLGCDYLPPPFGTADAGLTPVDPSAPVCNYNGKTYADGAEFPADDGCNSCKCNPTGATPGGWGCTAKACPDAGAPTCNYNGKIYADGAEFPADDGCNRCKCNPSGDTPGKWGCSLIGCSGLGKPDAAQ